jgi:hypothetical protein
MMTGIDGFRATETIEGANPRVARYPILPDDLLVRTGPHTYTKECPGIAVTGFVLTPDQEKGLRPVKFSRDGLEYSIEDGRASGRP